MTLELLDIVARYWIGSAATAKPASPSAVTRARARPQPFAVIMSVHNIRPRQTRVLAPLDAVQGQRVDHRRRFRGRHRRVPRIPGLALPASAKPTARSRVRSRRCSSVCRRRSARCWCSIRTASPCAPAYFGASISSRRCASFKQSGAAACCPRVRDTRGRRRAACFQLLEVELAFILGRKSLSPHCITCGASMYRREALERALEQHSLSVYAEDLENTLLILEQGQHILYDAELVLVTEGKRTLRGCSRSASAGRSAWPECWRSVGARSCESRTSAPWTFYNFVVYLGLVVGVLFPLKLASALLFYAGARQRVGHAVRASVSSRTTPSPTRVTLRRPTRRTRCCAHSSTHTRGRRYGLSTA